MADINGLISLGIGSPAGIEYFILDGLNATGEVAAPDPATITFSAETYVSALVGSESYTGEE